MNISKFEQRVLHALAQGGAIHLECDSQNKIIAAYCYTREGYHLVDCNLAVFKRLKHRRFISSRNSQPYQVTQAGLAAVRAQHNNQ